MARTIAGALTLMVVLLASCSVEEPEPSPRALAPSLAQTETPETPEMDAGVEDTPETVAETTAHENAGLRADYNAP